MQAPRKKPTSVDLQIVIRSSEFMLFRSIMISKPESMVIGNAFAIFQLRSEETVQIRLAVPQKVRAITGKVSVLGGGQRLSLLKMNKKRLDRVARPNRIIIPFDAYSPMIGIERPARQRRKQALRSAAQHNTGN